ncbi:hypothetical protein RASY3_02855 [Ruminococcus albus SY3]|uniref:Uncharacterized protein n=1 Tax=Ruminococcus albus SY3 TaxID=1341156 RepID=A0A011W0E7_RUMAL|nr:hypothetical protein RASY3_02855 [Ruminococcus albus SY3]
MNDRITELIKNSEYDDAYAVADEEYSGDYNALYEVYDEIYEAVSDEFGRSSEQAFVALRELAILDQIYVRYDEAIKLFRMYLEYVNENYDKAETDYYDIYARIAEMQEYSGELEESKRIRHEILSFCLESYGEVSKQTVYAFGGLAWNNYIAGNISEAVELFLQQYEMSLASDECNDEQYYLILQNIGRCYDDMKYRDKALEYLEKAYKSVVKAFGEEAQDTLSVMNDLAGIYSENGRKNEALEMYKKVLNTAKELLGEDCHDTNMAKLNLAREYGEAGYQDKSTELLSEAYEWFADKLGYAHSSTMLAMGNLANAYSRMRETEKALDMREKLYRVSAEAFGEDHPKTVKYFLYLGYSYKETGQLSAALDIADSACEKLRSIAEDDPEFLMEGLGRAAIFNMEAERYDKALELCDEFFEVSEKCGGVSLYDLETTYYVKSKTLALMNRFDEAIEAADRYLEVSAKLYGDDGTDPFYLDGLSDYAYILYKAGKYDEALEKVRYAIDRQQELGLEFPPLSRKQHLLADIYTAVGRYDDAEKILTELIEDSSENIGYLYSMARLKNTLGDKSAAFQYAEKCSELTADDDTMSHERRKCERLLEELKG